MNVVNSAAVGGLNASAFKTVAAYAARAAIDAVDRGIGRHRARETQPHRKMIVVGLVVIDLHVKLIGVLRKWAIDEIILSEKARKIRQRDNSKDFRRDGIDRCS